MCACGAALSSGRRGVVCLTRECVLSNVQPLSASPSPTHFVLFLCRYLNVHQLP